jgi:hypothetical protein
MCFISLYIFRADKYLAGCAPMHLICCAILTEIVQRVHKLYWIFIIWNLMKIWSPVLHFLSADVQTDRNGKAKCTFFAPFRTEGVHNDVFWKCLLLLLNREHHQATAWLYKALSSYIHVYQLHIYTVFNLIIANTSSVCQLQRHLPHLSQGKNEHQLHRIWGSHSGGYGEFYLPMYNAI